jgi:uncharacterized OsmC-like protein
MATTFKDVRKLQGERVRMQFDDGREVVALLLCATKDIDGSKHLIYDKVESASGAETSRTGATGHTILCDQPIENEGDDTGMTPPELILASLGSCAAFYAVQYLKARNLAETGVEVSVTADKLMQPPRLGNFKVTVVCPVSLTEDQNAGIMRAVHRCLIHNTLLSPPEILIELTMSEMAIQHA